MPRFKLTIEYAGTRYSGWQIQKNARTVQGELDRAIRTVTGRSDFELYGSGRTDAGVHALAQVAHLDVSTTLPGDTLVGRLNDELPADINILSGIAVPHRFHARHDAVARRYLYQIATRRTAFNKPFVWWVREPLALDRMRLAAAAFIGLKDFRSFAASDGGESDQDEAPAAMPSPKNNVARHPRSTRRGWGPGASGEKLEQTGDASPPRPSRPSSPSGPSSPRSTLVLVERLDILPADALILIGIEGSHFLWKMVRRIVGLLVEIGRGGLDPSAASAFLAESSAAPARLTAPPSGLFLERVWYAGDVREEPIRPATPLGHAGPSRTPSTRRTTSA